MHKYLLVVFFLSPLISGRQFMPSTAQSFSSTNVNTGLTEDTIEEYEDTEVDSETIVYEKENGKINEVSSKETYISEEIPREDDSALVPLEAIDEDDAIVHRVKRNIGRAANIAAGTLLIFMQMLITSVLYVGLGWNGFGGLDFSPPQWLELPM